jgi:hypothetical protein
MASLRKARRNFRKSVLQLVERGSGNTENLMRLADDFYNSEVLFCQIWKAFLQSEIGNAAAQLRNEGAIETIGNLWKPSDQLESTDVDVIIKRRVKRQLGEANALVKFAHEHGRVDVATAASCAAHVFDKHEEHTPVEEPAAVNR